MKLTASGLTNELQMTRIYLLQFTVSTANVGNFSRSQHENQSPKKIVTIVKQFTAVLFLACERRNVLTLFATPPNISRHHPIFPYKKD